MDLRQFQHLSYCPDSGIFMSGGKKIGALDGDGYIKFRVAGTSYKAHRLAFMFMGVWPILETMQVDHINGVRSDNRWNNLRLVTRTENCRNRRIGKNNSSGLIGVRWREKRGKWEARIYAEGVEISLGSHADLFSAACERKSAEIRIGFHENHGNRRGITPKRENTNENPARP